VKVNSANEMYLACCRFFENIDIAVFSAAVADYRPHKVSGQKIKKESCDFTIKMVKNVDIACEFGKIKTQHQFSIGFALETQNEIEHAKSKLSRKNFDMVILNSMNDCHATFGYDTNKITIIRKDLPNKSFPLKSKKEVAKDILHQIAALVIRKEFNLTPVSFL
jgi:phosphopantothenoylcysteine decarboxylase/phosphopantothenate--cysteine ligase